jgi:catechol 2,3-dioxygenase-like lactoylglutathione lyase family enzyme
MGTQSTFSTEWRGFHHIALVTPDLDATIKFYGDVLGMTIGDKFPATEQRGAHCFIKPGSTEAWGIHFFEYPDAELFTTSGFGDRFAFFRGALQHIAFGLPDEATGLALRKRLQSHHIELSPINTLGTLRNFLFTDNNGLLLEATWATG